MKYERKNGIVYEIKCNDYELSFVGQSCRKLKVRINEHKNNIKMFPSKQNSISKHRINHNHNINFENPKIIDYENRYKARMTSETLHIKTKNTMNTMLECNQFTTIYDNLMHRIKRNGQPSPTTMSNFPTP